MIACSVQASSRAWSDETCKGVAHVKPAALKAGEAPCKGGLDGNGIPQGVEVPGGAGEAHALLACCNGLLPALLPLQREETVQRCFLELINGCKE